MYTGNVIFDQEGENEILLTLNNWQANKTVKYFVKVNGYFRYRVLPIDVYFGRIRNGEESCRNVDLKVDQKSIVTLFYEFPESLPSGHSVIVSNATSRLGNSQNSFQRDPNDKIKFSLKTSARAPSSILDQQPILVLKLEGSTAKDAQVLVRFSWEVKGLSFLERWWWLILTILTLIILVIIILGYILPVRFRSTLHIAIGEDMEELNEYVPMQLKQWKGIGIGFYRNARAYLYDDFRISGKNKEASVEINAEKLGI